MEQTLREHLLYVGQPELVERKAGRYLVGSFGAGVGDEYPGVDSKIAWYSRNLRIFANIRRITEAENERILVVIGHGHLGILRHAAQASPEYDLVEVSEVLGSRAAARSIPVLEPLAPYVEFLAEEASLDPVGYLLGLFEEHDLVILAERWHPEATQYELITELVTDPRFIERVGTVFTELGARNLQGDLEEIMATPDLEREEVGRRLLPIFRNLGVYPFWDSRNFFDFLRDVYAVNQGRPPEEQVEVYFVDLPIDWSEMTPEAYAAYWKDQVSRRDRLMAEEVIARLRELDRQGGRPARALVIMNYRHASNRGDNVGRYLFEAFPERTANVMLNSLALLPGTTDREPVAEPIQGGKWDAAFRVAGIEEAGFDFAGSPFGRDRFDFFPFESSTVRYQDVFEGFVFYRPLSEHRLESGIPGLFDDGFEAEAKRRIAITGRTVEDAAFEALVDASVEPLIELYDRPDEIEAMISRWIDGSPAAR